MQKQTLFRLAYVYWILGVFGIGVLIAGLIYQTITLSKERQEHSTLTSHLSTTENTLGDTMAKYEDLAILFAKLQQDNMLCTEQATELQTNLEKEHVKNEMFDGQIKEISSTVGALDKLSKIDVELLQKYSKIYFLNEHYTPEKLLPITKKFLTRPDDVPEYIHARIISFLENLLMDAEDDGIHLRVLSAYRSYDEQRDLKGAYSLQYGTGANTFSADQGYSEHQLGTTVDFTSTEIGGSLTGFETTEAYAWLKKYAHRYGFIISYPENNGYYIFEPWHWRFVGKDLADDLHDDEKSFYNLEQREIDAYLISIFD